MARTSSADPRRALTAQVKRAARDTGFDFVGVAAPDDFTDAEHATLDRIRSGLMDGLPWFHEARVKRGASPAKLLPGVRSILALGLSYHTPDPTPPPSDDALRGRVSRYAWGRDYHRVMERRAKALVASLEALGGGAARFYVDYGPMPDRAAAQRAGLGWFGKNTNILTSDAGSWVFLAEILTDLDLEPDEPLKKNCGSCIACIPACPTNAIPAPYVIDNTRCISYHTIENRGPIPQELRPHFGDWVFGCDICQDVCPVNDRNADTPGDEEFAASDVDRAYPDLIELLALSKDEFTRRFRGTPLLRAKYEGMQRNVCVALGNAGDARAVPALRRALAGPSALVRSHAAWALGHIGGSDAEAALRAALPTETDPAAREEIEAALAELG